MSHVTCSPKFNPFLVADLARHMAAEVHENGDAVLAMYHLAIAISLSTESVHHEHARQLGRPATQMEAAASILMTSFVAAAVDLGCGREQVLDAVRQGFEMITSRIATANTAAPVSLGGVN